MRVSVTQVITGNISNDAFPRIPYGVTHPTKAADHTMQGRPACKDVYWPPECGNSAGGLDLGHGDLYDPS